MARKKIPVVEVTAPNGTTSFWGAYSIPYDGAVAAVRAILPAKYTVELSLRRLPPGYRFVGARPGDIIPLGYDPTLDRRVRSTSARSASFLGQLPGAAMDDLDQIAAQLTAAVLDMPPGHQRQDALREIGRLRSRMHALLRAAAEFNESKSKQNSSSSGSGTK
jgi:hypothetical protein